MAELKAIRPWRYVVLSHGTAKPACSGAFVSDKEMKILLDILKKSGVAKYRDDVLDQIKENEGSKDDLSNTMSDEDESLLISHSAGFQLWTCFCIIL